MADSGNVWAATVAADAVAISVAPLGTTLPTSATATLDNAFVDLGWVGEDGVTNSIKRDTTKHYAWGGRVVKTTQDRYTETIKFMLLESNADVLAVAYGTDNVTESGDSITVEHSSLMLERQVFVIDFIDGDRQGRIVCREGLVTELADVKYSHKELLGYDLTVDLYETDNGQNAVVAYFDYTPGS
jgi:hypothetical protein